MALDFRTKYRKLDEEEQLNLEELKCCAEALDGAIDDIFVGGSSHVMADQMRHIAHARYHLEAAVMFAVKAMTA